MDDKSIFFEVAVIGGGPAGAAAAINLSRLGHKVVLLEQSGYNTPKIGETIYPSTKPILNSLGVWTTFNTIDSIPCYGIQSSWGGNDLVSDSFIISPFGSGWHIDRQRFDAMLADAATKVGVVVLTHAHVTDVISDSSAGWKINFRRVTSYSKGNVSSSNSEPFRAKAIINASGKNSCIFRELGVRQIVYDNLVGLAVRFNYPECLGSFLLIEPFELGWWYSSAIPGSGLIVVLITDSDILVKNGLSKMGQWMNYLAQTEHTKARVGNSTTIWGPRIFRASSIMLSRSNFEDKWLAVGDAELAFDPISSKGIPFALNSGIKGAGVIHHCLTSDFSLLRTYQREMEEQFAQYLNLRQYYYSLETRWSDEIFWKRRSTPTKQLTGTLKI